MEDLKAELKERIANWEHKAKHPYLKASEKNLYLGRARESAHILKMIELQEK